MRPYLLPVSAMAGLAGLSLSGLAPGWRVGLAMLVFSLSYGLGQALTDCFQLDTDRISAPYRPLVKGIVTPRQVFAVSAAGLVAGLVVLAVLNPWNVALAALSIFALAVHTPLKRRWWAAAPVENALVVGLLPLMGWLAEPTHSLPDVLGRLDVLAVGLAGLARYTNFVVVGYLKDIDADRRTGYVTLPVRFGWLPAACVSHVWAGAALGATAWAVGLLTRSVAPWCVLGAAALLSLATQGMVHRTRRQDQAYKPIAHTVRVFLLLHVAMVWAAEPGWWPAAACVYAAFELLAAVRPDRRQV